MNRKLKINHHSVSIIPYHIDLENNLHFILEQKDSNYKAPYFNNGLNFIGGNWQKGVHSEKSPKETLEREINEEFWNQYEAPESLNDILREEFLKTRYEIMAKYNIQSIEQIKVIGQILLDEAQHLDDYMITVPPPIMNDELIYLSSIFSKKLSLDEFQTINEVLNEFEGVVTTDNLKWNSKVVSVSLDDINSQGMKFAWGYDKIINQLKSHIPPIKEGIIMPSELINIEKINPLQKIESSTYQMYERKGMQYVANK